jgi:transposase-like protein
MSDTGRRLCDLIEHAVNASEPDVSLRALAALRQDLEEFERLQVARALSRGTSFGRIARALGISRQSAHRRYRDLAQETPVEDDAQQVPSRRHGRILVTSEVRAAVRLAREEAAHLGSSTVGSEHLLLGILRVDDARAARALRRHGVDLETARARIQPTLVDGESPREVRVPEGPKGISDHARTVFENSLREAVRGGDGYIGPEHLLVAALRSPAGGASRTLSALQVDRESVTSAALA